MTFFSELLSMLEDVSCDFNHFFYRLGNTPIFTFITQDEYFKAAEKILPADPEIPQPESIKKLATWLEDKYRLRLEKDGVTNDTERQQKMNAVNPKFVLRQWVLEEVIRKTESEKGVGVKNKEMLDLVLAMALEPFKEGWGIDKEEEERLCGEVPKLDRGFQCSCSS